MGGLFDMMDDAIAHELGVDLYTYIKIIDHKCTDEEANFIILTIMEEDANNLEKAKQMFNKYLQWRKTGIITADGDIQKCLNNQNK